MFNIDGIQPVSAPKAVEPAQPPLAAQGQTGPGWVADIVDISTASILAAKIHQAPGVRADLIQRVREEIEAGTYETQERIDVTVDKLMDELFPQQ